jgi:hypothetical protein
VKDVVSASWSSPAAEKSICKTSLMICTFCDEPVAHALDDDGPRIQFPCAQISRTSRKSTPNDSEQITDRNKE